MHPGSWLMHHPISWGALRTTSERAAPCPVPISPPPLPPPPCNSIPSGLWGILPTPPLCNIRPSPGSYSGSLWVCEATPLTIPRKCFYAQVSLGQQNRDCPTVSWLKGTPSLWLTRCSRAQTAIFQALSGETACASTKGWHRNFRHMPDVLTTAQGSQGYLHLFTALLTETYSLNTERNEWPRSNACSSMNSLVPSCWESMLSLKASATF